MARTAAREAPEEIELEATEIERQNDEIFDTISAELDSSPDDVEWALRVYRVTGSPRNGASEPYLFSLDYSELGGLRDKLRDEYGSGLYRVKVRKNKILYRQFDISVEALPKIETPQVQTQLDGLLQAMERQNRTMMEMFQSLREKPLQQTIVAPVDPLDTMSKMIAMMAGMKNLMPQAPENGAEKTMELVLKGIELGKSVSGEGGGGETGIMDLIKEAIKQIPIGDLIGGMRNGAGNSSGAAAMPDPHPLSQIAGTQINGAQPPPSNAPNNQPTPANGQNAFIGALNYLISRAAKGSPPEMYADWATDNLPPDIIKQLISTPDALAQLQAAVPALVPYNAWFARLLEELKFIMQDGESPREAQNAEGDLNVGSDSPSVA